MANQDAFPGIGELGRRTGLAPSALRYYERVGLLMPDGRTNGRRYYGPASVERIALIRLCQDAGFTLAEIRAVIATGSRRNPSWMRLMEGKLLELKTSIARGKQAKALIEHALACRHRELSMCPNFRAALKARLKCQNDNPARTVPGKRLSAKL
jgi:MerR family transcriptional regulator, redox-sensitive transcriptional activator SoxR